MELGCCEWLQSGCLDALVPQGHPFPSLLVFSTVNDQRSRGCLVGLLGDASAWCGEALDHWQLSGAQACWSERSE